MNNLLSTSQCTINIVQLIQLGLAIGVSLLRSVTVPGAIHTFQIRIGWWLLSGLRSTHGKQPNEHMRTTVIISSSINGSSRNTMSVIHGQAMHSNAHLTHEKWRDVGARVIGELWGAPAVPRRSLSLHSNEHEGSDAKGGGRGVRWYEDSCPPEDECT